MTATIATLPTPWAVLGAALRERRPVWLSYHGRRRLICPHALGWHNNRPLVLGYQTGGETSNGALPADTHLCNPAENGHRSRGKADSVPELSGQGSG